MKKEIIGYRLVKPEYYQASSYIMYENMAGSISLDDYLSIDHYALHRLEEAGVLDLWFEPVYKEKEKEFEFGRWYKSNKGNIAFIASINSGYGFVGKRWFDDTNSLCNNFNLDDWQPATDTEVKERLLAYAKDKYVVGTRYKDIEYGSIETVKKYGFNGEHGIYCSGGSSLLGIAKYIYRDGKWAEIISEPDRDEELNDVADMLRNAIDKLENIV